MCAETLEAEFFILFGLKLAIRFDAVDSGALQNFARRIGALRVRSGKIGKFLL